MLEIKCINKENRYSIYERITHIGGANPSGSNWKLTQKEAVDSINSKKYSFFVNIGGDKVNVVVAKSRFGHDYIKTENDGDEPNNLLSLRECVS